MQTNERPQRVHHEPFLQERKGQLVEWIEHSIGPVGIGGGRYDKDHRCAQHQGLPQHARRRKTLYRAKPGRGQPGHERQRRCHVARPHRPPRVCLVGNGGADEGDVQDRYHSADNGFGPAACARFAIARHRDRADHREERPGRKGEKAGGGQEQGYPETGCAGAHDAHEARMHGVLQDEVVAGLQRRSEG